MLKLNKTLPLDDFPAIRSRNQDQIANYLNARLGAKISVRTENTAGLAMHANCYTSKLSELWFCSYEAPIQLEVPESDCYRMQFHFQGKGATTTEGQEIAIRHNSVCISSKPAVINFDKGFQQLSLKVDQNALVSKLIALTGAPIKKKIEFKRQCDLNGSKGKYLQHTFSHFLNLIEDSAPGRLITEVEQALLVSLLYAAESNYTASLHRSSPAVARWQVRQAEEYIEANWDKPLNIENIALTVGSSVRSIFRAFQEDRGYSPMSFAKKVRLEKARQLLQSSSGNGSVTEIAYTTGFANPSQFSEDYKHRFSELPSETLFRRAIKN